MYDTPSGRIVGACLLGKPYLCEEYLKENHGFFPEGGGEVDSLTALCYYAADRRYNLPVIEKYLNDGYTLIVDRYVTSNMAHRRYVRNKRRTTKNVSKNRYFRI